MDTTALVPMMQQTLYAKPVEQGTILRKFPGFEVVDQTNCGQHERIAS